MVENSDVQTTLKAEDFLDCDGTHGINAILIDTSALWCPACQQEAGQYHRSGAIQRRPCRAAASGDGPGDGATDHTSHGLSRNNPPG